MPALEAPHTPALPATQSRQQDLALLAFLARAFDHPFSETALNASLPAGLDLSHPADLSRALAALGLKSRLISARAQQIDPAVLPCILFQKDGRTSILVDVSSDLRTFTIVEPSEPSLRIDVPLRDFRRRFTDKRLLITSLRAETRLDPGQPSERAWFWRPVLDNWTGWTQVFFAALCLNLLTLALPLFVMNVYDRVVPNLAFVTLWTLTIGVGIALGLELLLRALRSAVLERIAARVDLRVAATLFEQAMNIRLMARPGGAKVANTIRDFESVRDFFGSASFVALIDLLFIGVFIAALFFVVGPLAWLPLLAIPIVLVLGLFAQLPLRRSATQSQALAAQRHIVLVEGLNGIEAIKSLNGEATMQREWENAIAASARIGGQTRFWSGLATSGTQLVQQAVSVGIIVLGVFLLSEGQITLGALIAANILAGRVLAPLAAIAQTIFRTHYALSSMSALTDLMALPRERDPTGSQSSFQVTSGAVAFDEVVFRYPRAEHPALRGVSFDIKPGETVALLGRVGSGKTTTGKLMNGLLQPESGTILIDGQSIAQYDPAELRDGVGYLTQDPELFTGTLRENMMIGAPQASEDEMLHALYLAGLDAFVASSSEGLDMHIGDRGNRLSGGQKQGVALARLLLRDTSTLFLDEPTNAMDQQMEAAVTARLGGLRDGTRTLIFCTHRMSLAALADRFIVIDQGRIVLDGPRSAVLEQLRAAQTDAVEG